MTVCDGVHGDRVGHRVEQDLRRPPPRSAVGIWRSQAVRMIRVPMALSFRTSCRKSPFPVTRSEPVELARYPPVHSARFERMRTKTMTIDLKNFRSIKIALWDGNPSSTRSAAIDGSTTQAIGFRRNQLKKLREKLRKEITQAGAYILMDGNDAVIEREAYIGESENVLGRLKTHYHTKATKELWEDTIVLVSKDDNLTKSHARYVESLLLSEARNNPRWKLPTNSRKPSNTAGRLPLADRVNMEKFVTEAKILVGVLGCDIFRSPRVKPDHSVASNQADADQTAATFSLRGKGYDAKMTLSSSGHFIVKTGSNARKALAPKSPSIVRRLRQSMKEDGDLRPEGSSLVFNSDYVFSSVSAAAGVVCGFSVNGRNAWKNDEGKTYGEWEAAQSEPPSKDE